jgi:hypothetical protein
MCAWAAAHKGAERRIACTDGQRTGRTRTPARAAVRRARFRIPTPLAARTPRTAAEAVEPMAQ